MEQLSLFLQKQILTLSVFRVVFFFIKICFRAAKPTRVFFDQGWRAQTVNIINYDIDDSSLCKNSLAGFNQFFPDDSKQSIQSAAVSAQFLVCIKLVKNKEKYDSSYNIQQRDSS